MSDVVFIICAIALSALVASIVTVTVGVVVIIVKLLIEVFSNE